MKIPEIAIIRYNAGNVESVRNAIQRLGADAVVTDDADLLRSAKRVIFPGVGEASSAMARLRGNGLAELIPTLTQPVLGICLGMQLLCAVSDENDAGCLGVLPYRVRRFQSEELKIPHVGWNRIKRLNGPLFDGVDEGSHVYFVHGFFVPTVAESIASCDYGGEFSAAVAHRNFFATQFHPEKSGETGERILANFLKI